MPFEIWTIVLNVWSEKSVYKFIMPLPISWNQSQSSNKVVDKIGICFQGSTNWASGATENSVPTMPKCSVGQQWSESNPQGGNTFRHTTRHIYIILSPQWSTVGNCFACLYLNFVTVTPFLPSNTKIVTYHIPWYIIPCDHLPTYTIDVRSKA